MQTYYNKDLQKINVVPQDMGRVFLNLFTNAFYAVGEKKKRGVEDYEPVVRVYTSKLNSFIEIRIKDNGDGMSQDILDKIYQPFFTTKPAGHGTGLGLSISYDIIKAHGGELSVNTKEGEFAEFIIKLPIVL
jgi:signal transduction histidine kinase